MTHIAMLLSNAFRPDPRVAREAETLSNAGFHVTVLAWDRESRYPAVETVGGYTVERIQSVRTSYGSGLRQVLHMPRFWLAAARRIRALHPEAIHCHDLDTLPVGWFLKHLTGTYLVYDAHEDYPTLMSLYLPSFMVRLLACLERGMLSKVDQIIAASSQFAAKLRRLGYSQVRIIGNYPLLEQYDSISEKDIIAARSRLGLGSQDYIIAYIGGFTLNRLLLPLIEAVRDLVGVQVLLFGDGPQRDAVTAAVADASNVRYLGWLPYAQVALHTCIADVIYYCLRPDYPGALYNAPNTLSSAMAAGRPIIANNVGDLGEVVKQTGCGLLLEEVTPATIRQAIETLWDPNLRRELGERGRRAAETQYNWQVTAQHLIGLYSKFIKPGNC